MSYGYPSRRLNYRRTRRLASMNLACDIYLRVIIVQLYLFNRHSLVNYCVIGSIFRPACLLKSQLKIKDWLKIIVSILFFATYVNTCIFLSMASGRICNPDSEIEPFQNMPGLLFYVHFGLYYRESQALEYLCARSYNFNRFCFAKIDFQSLIGRVWCKQKC